MSDNGSNTPSWVRTATRVDRPNIDVWYKPEQHGPLEGTLIWRGQEHARSGDLYNAYAIRGVKGAVFGVAERAGLRGLRTVRVGSRVFIRPTTVKELESGHRMQQFEIVAEQIEPMSEPLKSAASRDGGSSDSDAVGGGNAPDGAAATEEVPF